jgi:hypothetical protein
MKDVQLENNCYEYILEHLDSILCDVDIDVINNPTVIKNIIKLHTYNYLLESDSLYFTEGFKDIADTFKSLFWSNTVNAWTGKVSMSNWLAGVGLKTFAPSLVAEPVKQGLFGFGKKAAETGGFKVTNFAASGLSEVFKKILPAGFSTLALRIAFVSIFPTVLIGLATYSLIRHRDILKLKNFERNLKTAIESIKLNNKKDFKSTYKTLNNQYSLILKNNCSRISNDKDKLKCASSHYIKYMTEIILKELIVEYVVFIKNQKFDISYMTTFQELFKFSFNKNNIINKRFNFLYTSYMECLDVYDFNNKKSYYIKYLDREVKNNVKN